MKHILISIFTLFFLTNVSAFADELIDSEEAVQEIVAEDEVVEDEVAEDETTEEAVPEKANQKTASANTDTPSDEELEAARAQEEVAHAEEEELREVGAGEEPILEE